MKNSITYNFHEMDFFVSNKIHFNSSKTPKVSIIIPVYNALLYTLNCLYSLAKDCENHEVEIIVINDNSTDNTKEYLETISSLKVINNVKNLGFLKNINKGINAANGDYILLLNNDVIVLPNLLDELFSIFKNKKNVGAVGAKAIHPTGVTLEAGSKIFSNGEVVNIGRLSSPENPHYNHVKKVNYCSGYCLLLKRRFPNNELVQLDETFLPAYYEETDLCMQLKYNYNLNIYYQPFAKLIHFESISYGDEKNNIKQGLIDANCIKFKEKWRDVLLKNHEINRKHSKNFNDEKNKGNSIVYLDDVINSQLIEEKLSNNTHEENTTLLLKSKKKIDEEEIEQLRRIGIAVLYPYKSSRGKNRSYLKILSKISAGNSKIKTNNIFYMLYFKLFS